MALSRTSVLPREGSAERSGARGQRIGALAVWLTLVRTQICMPCHAEEALVDGSTCLALLPRRLSRSHKGKNFLPATVSPYSRHSQPLVLSHIRFAHAVLQHGYRMAFGGLGTSVNPTLVRLTDSSVRPTYCGSTVPFHQLLLSLQFPVLTGLVQGTLVPWRVWVQLAHTPSTRLRVTTRTAHPHRLAVGLPPEPDTLRRRG